MIRLDNNWEFTEKWSDSFARFEGEAQDGQEGLHEQGAVVSVEHAAGIEHQKGCTGDEIG